jgi:hypothetical protein
MIDPARLEKKPPHKSDSALERREQETEAIRAIPYIR